jgi:hypothetical protein
MRDDAENLTENRLRAAVGKFSDLSEGPEHVLRHAATRSPMATTPARSRRTSAIATFRTMRLNRLGAAAVHGVLSRLKRPPIADRERQLRCLRNISSLVCPQAVSIWTITGHVAVSIREKPAAESVLKR